MTTVAVLCLCLTACSSDDDPPTPTNFDASTGPVTTPDASDMGPTGWDAAALPDANSLVDAAVDAATSDASVDAAAADGGDPAFASCVAALKPKCSYEEKEVACSSITTAKIPLSNGGVHGDVELKQGPHGAYVEWNEGTAFINPENLLEATCSVAAGVFAEPASVTADVLNLRGQDLMLYTIFRPACMRPGETYPVITWGNGTCGQSGGYGGLNATLASHGYVVISSNSRWTNQGNKEMLRALDLAKAINEDPAHPLYQRLDLTKVGAMGHSQGGAATVEAAKDPRVKAVILWNGGRDAVKPFLAISGDRDRDGDTVQLFSRDALASQQPAAWLWYHKVLVTGGTRTGHLTLMMEPERVVQPAIAWWNFILKGDQEAKKMFVGADCGLCNQAQDFEYGQDSLP